MTAAAASAAVPDLISLADAAAKDAAALVAEARRRVRAKVVADGRIAAERLEAEQHAAHGLAWLATYAEAIREMAAYARRLSGEGRFGETEDLLVRIGIGEYLDQVFGGIPMSQGEIVRPHALGLSGRDLARYRTEAVETLIETGNTAENRARLVALIRAGQGAPTIGDSGLDDTLEAIRAEMRRFGEAEVAPHAHEWHLANEYIPLVGDRAHGRARRVRAHHPGGVRRHGAVEGLDVRRLGGAVARLYRRRLARHALRDRRRADPRRRHRGAEAALPAQDRVGRDPADRGLHRAEHRLGPRGAAHPRRAPGRRLQGVRQQDLDHPSGPRRSDDASRAHEPRRARPQGAVDPPGREAARHGRRSRSRSKG